MSYIFNNWDSIKPKEKKKLRNKIYRNLLKMDVCTMFEYSGLPDNINQIFLEDILFFNGTVGFGKLKGELTCFYGGHCGKVDNFGLGTEYTGATPNGDISGKIGVDVEVGYNNNTLTPEALNILRYVDFFTEIDTSLDCNLINARFHNIPVAKDKKSKAQIETVMDKIIDGIPQSVMSDNVLFDELGGNPFDLIQMTDVNASDKIQYLYQFREYIKKDFFNHYGQAMQTTNKLAQVNSDEIHGEDSTSFIYAYNRLKQRETMCEKVNKLFGTNISVDFSLPWKIEYEKFLNSSDENIDESMEKEDQETSSNDSVYEKEDNSDE